MQIISNRKELQKTAVSYRKEGKSIGLVPTMGYLHEGHESLIKRARAENDIVIVSVFVNPIQFGPGEDLDVYPRDFDRDRAICEAIGVDVIFHPAPEEMYEPDRSVNVHVSDLTEGLCGASRPGHFDGVCVVVNKLFNLSLADRAYFGQKDAQQLAVIRRMVRDLDIPVEIIGCPIIREEDGLAKSSRNVYLDAESRQKAPQIHQALLKGRSIIEQGEKDVSSVESKVRAILSEVDGFEVEYIRIVSWDGLKEIKSVEGPVLMATAVRAGNVRLIDNEIIP